MPEPTLNPVDEIKSRLSIVEVISPHVQLKKAGRNFKGLCPFHNEKTPSFIVFPDQGTYHCFGCHAGGDIFTFVMKTQNVEFGDALRMLAERANVVLPEYRATPEEEEAHRRVFELTAAAGTFFHDLLLRSPAAEKARRYLERREVSAATIDSFQLGFAPDEWEALGRYLLGKGYTADEVVTAGLAIRREGGGGQYDRFRNRVIFPIRDLKGRVVGFGGRVLDDSQPKYLNSSDTPIFAKGSNLYAADFARSPIIEADQAVVVEGYMDALAAHQRGFRNVVASLGTAISEEQLRTLKRFTKNIVLALDPDLAGAEATLRGLDVARESLDRVAVPVPTWRGYIRYEQRLDANLRIATLPPGKDPDEVLREDPQEWARRIAAAAPVVDYYLQSVLSRADLSSPRGIAEAVNRVAPLLAEIADPTARAVYTQRLADHLEIDGRRLSERVAQERGRTARRRSASAVPAAPAAAPASPEPAAGETAGVEHTRARALPAVGNLLWERYLVSLTLTYPDALPLLEDVTTAEIEDSVCCELLRRRMEWPGEWSMEAFLASLGEGLDVVLREFVVELSLRAGDEPKLSYPALQKEMREAVAELRRSHLRKRIQDLHYMKRAAEEAGDTASVRDLIAQTESLLAQLGPYDTQGRARALVWR